MSGGATQETVEKAFRIITRDPNVKCILINIFGGIVRCDMVAAGVIAAFKNINLQIPWWCAWERDKFGGSTYTCQGIRTWRKFTDG
ncbi:MAG: hypothetical protein CM1200mP30_15080 [Pseudomonadota bacterium]|nr:MAG: hypothetical protein CM1200mP30_15080 [Pseudomonadota bacterium]